MGEELRRGMILMRRSSALAVDPAFAGLRARGARAGAQDPGRGKYSELHLVDGPPRIHDKTLERLARIIHET